MNVLSLELPHDASFVRLELLIQIPTNAAQTNHLVMLCRCQCALAEKSLDCPIWSSRPARINDLISTARLVSNGPAPPYRTYCRSQTWRRLPTPYSRASIFGTPTLGLP